MKQYRRGERALAMALAGSAGFADSVGFMFFGGVFLSFMSGNTTRIAVSGIEGQTDLMWLSVRCVALFVVGVMLGTVVHRVTTQRFNLYRAREAVLAFVSLLMLASSLLHAFGPDLAAMLVISLAIGALNSAFERSGEVAVPLTYVTGTLVKAAQRFVDSFFGGDKTAWVYPLLMWVCLAFGGGLGAASFHNFGLDALYILTAWLVAATVVNQLKRERRRALGLPL